MNVLIPAYKPDERLITLVGELIEEGYNLYVVNDGSGSDYDKVFAALPSCVTLLVHEVNCGKGRAMKTGFKYIMENYDDDQGVIIADADGQHIVTDIAKVRDELLENPKSLVLGARLFEGDVPFKSRFGNNLTRGAFAFAAGKKLKDTQTGLRGIPFEQLAHMAQLKGERYEYEMNMLFDAVENSIPIREVGIKTIYLEQNASSHFNVLRDSFKIYAVILKFAFSSLTAFLIDYGVFALLSIFTVNMADVEISLLIATVGARIVSSLFNYFINRNIVFKNKAPGSFIKYFALVAFMVACSYGLLFVASVVLGIDRYLAKIIVDFLLFFANFILQRLFVFKPKSQKVVDN